MSSGVGSNWYFPSVGWFVKIDANHITYLYFQTHEHEKLTTTFFTEYFPSRSVCYKNLRFCWKLLRTIICPLELQKLIITFFQEKNEKNVNLLQPLYISKNISIYTGACHQPPQNGFRERKVYHNFVLILYNFVHRVPNFVRHFLLRYR